MKGLIIQLGIDLQLSYNILKRYNDIDRLVIDELFEWDKLVGTTEFFEGIEFDDIKPFSTYHRVFPIFLVMYKNLRSNRDILHNISEELDKVVVKGMRYKIDEIIRIRKHIENNIDQANIEQYNYVGFYTMSRSTLYMTLAMMLVKQKYPNKKLIAGGPWFEVEQNISDMFVEFNILDGYLIGDGEEIELGNIQGKVINFCSDLNALKLAEPTVQTIPWNQLEAIFFTASRGCNFNCSFCQQGIQKFRTMTPENVAEYVKECVKKTGVKRMFIADNIFFAKKEWLFSFRDEIAKRNLLGELEFYSCNIHPSYFEDDKVVDAIEQLKAHPFIGIESFSNPTLKKMNKRTTRDLNIKIVEKLRKRGIEFTAGRIFQYPGETEDEFQESLEEYLKMFTWNVHSRYLGVFCLFPNTPMFKNAEKYGIEFKYFPDNVYEYAPEFEEYLKQMPYRYIDKTDPDGERFIKLNNKIRIINEKICKIFPL